MMLIPLDVSWNSAAQNDVSLHLDPQHRVVTWEHITATGADTTDCHATRVVWFPEYAQQ